MVGEVEERTSSVRDDVLRVFISSRMEELAPERAVIASAARDVGFDPWLYEVDAGARPGPPRETYLEALVTCDVYVAIFWRTRGAYTVDEFDDAGRKGIRRLVYEKVADPSEREPGLQALLDVIGHVESGVSVCRFRDAMDLGQRVTDDLRRVQADLRRSYALNGGTYTTTEHGGRYDRRSKRTPIRREATASSTCSPPPDPFFDRVETSERIQGAVASGETLVGLRGEPGIGKSALLRRLAQEPSWSPDRFPDGAGACFDAGPTPHVGDLLRAVWHGFYRVGDVLFVPDDGELHHGLNDKRALLFVDNVGLPADQVERLRHDMPASTFVVAGHDPESDDLGPLSYVKAVSLGGFEDVDDMVALFESVLRRQVPAAVRDGVAALCRRVGGSPGRITSLANAAWGSDRPIEEWVEGHLVATDEPADSLAVRRLGAPERRALLVLAAFGPGVATPGEVMGLLDVADSDLVAGRGAGLVVQDASGFRLPEAVHVAVTLSEEPHHLRPEVFDATVRWVEHASPERISQSREFLLRVLAWGAEQDRPRGVLILARALNEPLALGGAWGSWGVVIDRAMDAASALGDEEARAWSLHERGTRALMLGEHRKARRDLKAARRIRRKRGEGEGVAVTKHNLSAVIGIPWLSTKGWIIMAVGIVAVVAALVLIGVGNPPVIEFGEVAAGTTEEASYVLESDGIQTRHHHIGIQGDDAFCVMVEGDSACGQSPGAAGSPAVVLATLDPSTLWATIRAATPAQYVPSAPECRLVDQDAAGVVVAVPASSDCSVAVTFTPRLEPGETVRDFRGELRSGIRGDENTWRLRGRGIRVGNGDDDEGEPGTDTTEGSVPSTSTSTTTTTTTTSMATTTSTTTATTTTSTTTATTTTTGVPQPRILTVATTAGGSVTSDDGQIACRRTCRHRYADGANVTLTGVADPGYDFAGWGGACRGSGGGCTVTMGGDITVTAQFEQMHDLSVSVDGPGSVEDIRLDIHCRDECPYRLPEGAAVTLTAVADDDNVFLGWDGACTGNRPQCSLRMTADVGVFATFGR